MNFFNFDIKKVLLIIFLVLIPFLFITLSRTQTENNIIFKSLIFINSGMQSVHQSITASIYDTTNTYLNLINTNKINKKLLQENKILKSHYSLMKEVQQENKRLNSLLHFKKTNNFNFIAARVIGRDPISEYQLITINRGNSRGIKKNMIVITELGVVGYVFRVLSNVSQVILLTDPHAALPAVIQRSRVHGIIEGFNHTSHKFNYLKRRDDVKKGDIIVTSGLNPLVYGGFPIGIVTRIKKQKYGLTQEVTVVPFVNSTQLEEVFIVNKK